MHKFVVFDNNAYKAINQERLKRIISAERDLGIVPLASLVVLQELLARVRDSDEKIRARNRWAIKKLEQHCLVIRDSNSKINFLNPVDSQVYHLLNGDQHPRDIEMLKLFEDMVSAVVLTDFGDPLSQMSNDLDKIEKIVEQIEKDYVTMLNAITKGKRQPNQMKRNLDYASHIVHRVQAFYGCQFPPQKIIPHIISVAKITSIGFALQDLILEDIRLKGVSPANHGNSIWDEEVVSSTSIYTTINGSSILLVTQEGLLLAAAKSAQATDHVCNVASYEQSLGLPVWKASQT